MQNLLVVKMPPIHTTISLSLSLSLSLLISSLLISILYAPIVSLEVPVDVLGIRDLHLLSLSLPLSLSLFLSQLLTSSPVFTSDSASTSASTSTPPSHRDNETLPSTHINSTHPDILSKTKAPANPQADSS